MDTAERDATPDASHPPEPARSWSRVVALLAGRPDLRGVLAMADFVDDGVRWSA